MWSLRILRQVKFHNLAADRIGSWPAFVSILRLLDDPYYCLTASKSVDWEKLMSIDEVVDQTLPEKIRGCIVFWCLAIGGLRDFRSHWLSVVSSLLNIRFPKCLYRIYFRVKGFNKSHKFYWIILNSWHLSNRTASWEKSWTDWSLHETFIIIVELREMWRGCKIEQNLLWAIP